MTCSQSNLWNISSSSFKMSRIYIKENYGWQTDYFKRNKVFHLASSGNAFTAFIVLIIRINITYINNLILLIMTIVDCNQIQSNSSVIILQYQNIIDLTIKLKFIELTSMYFSWKYFVQASVRIYVIIFHTIVYFIWKYKYICLIV